MTTKKSRSNPLSTAIPPQWPARYRQTGPAPKLAHWTSDPEYAYEQFARANPAWSRPNPRRLALEDLHTMANMCERGNATASFRKEKDGLVCAFTTGKGTLTLRGKRAEEFAAIRRAGSGRALRNPKASFDDAMRAVKQAEHAVEKHCSMYGWKDIETRMPKAREDALRPLGWSFAELKAENSRRIEDRLTVQKLSRLAGEVIALQKTTSPPALAPDTCTACRGTGYAGVHGDTCTRCDGSGADVRETCDGCRKTKRASQMIYDSRSDENLCFSCYDKARENPRRGRATRNPEDQVGVSGISRPVYTRVPVNAGPYLPEMYPYGMFGRPASYSTEPAKAKSNGKKGQRKTKAR